MKANVNLIESQNLEQKSKNQNLFGLNQTFKTKNHKIKGKEKGGRFENA